METKEIHRITEKSCPKHGVYIWETTNKVTSVDNKHPHHVSVCPECRKEQTSKELAQMGADDVMNATLSKTYDVLERQSIIPPKLAYSSYKTFSVANEVDKKAKDFGLFLNEYYFKHDGKGNAILQGAPGVGKSHLTIAIARKLNDDYKAINEPKSVLFFPVNRLFQKIQAGFDNKQGVTREQMMNLLVKADFLFLDDLGKETTFGNHGNEASNWKQEFLYELLDMRQRTIINTNMTGEQLKKTYDPALVSRIMDGVGNNIFAYPKEAEDRRKMPF